jgi:bifunctional aspartokinase / homoserine dehydrogenase 2
MTSLKYPPIESSTSEALGRQVHKFGGSSLADPPSFQRVVTLLAQQSGADDLIVVSAAGHTTNQLIQWVALSRTGSRKAASTALKLYYFQRHLIQRLLAVDRAQSLIESFEQEWQQLTKLLPSAVAEANTAEIIGQGEVWSARLLAALLNQQGLPAVWLDARCFLRAERAVLPKIDEGRSYPLLAHCLAQYPQQRLVITGFISRNQAGETVLLGRNGSDYSATQIGALATVNQVTLWSDVAGLYSADPHVIHEACLLPQLRLDEASELARLAVPVLHTRTLQPLASSPLALQLRSSIHPDRGCTRIERVLASARGAKIVAHHDNLFLIELQVPEQCDQQPLQQQITTQLQQAGLPPLTWGLQPQRGTLQWSYTHEVAHSAFQQLQQVNLPGELRLHSGRSLIALVGHDISQHGLQQDTFYHLLEPHALEHCWHSPEGHSIAAILHCKTIKPLLQQLHHALFQRQQRLGIVLFSQGPLANQWLVLFAQQQKRRQARQGCQLLLGGVIQGERAWLDNQGIEAHRALAFFEDEARVQSQASLEQWLIQHPFDQLAIIDTTNHPTLPHRYHTYAKLGLHLITSNCLSGSLNHEAHTQLIQAFKQANGHWLFSGAVGAGLPINALLQTLYNSGDKLLTLSSTLDSALSGLFQHYDGTIAFTEWVKQAWQQGLLSGDPRVHLSGELVVHQLVMLVRAAGYPLEASQVRLESLVPPSLAARPLEAFFEHNNPLNLLLQQRAEAAQSAQLTLCYVARFNLKEGARVGIEALTPQHPLVTLSSYEQVFVIESRCYQDPPLVLRGPSHRPDAIAGAIQSDLNQLASLL